MKLLVWTLALAAVLSLSSCFLVSIPVKATGEMIEKSAHATGDAMNRGIHKVTRPDASGASRNDQWDGVGDDDSAGDLEHLPPLLPAR